MVDMDHAYAWAWDARPFPEFPGQTAAVIDPYNNSHQQGQLLIDPQGFGKLIAATEQRGWIKGRNDCWKADDKKGCAKTEYQRRIAELQAHYQLVESIGPIRFQCGDSPADELIVTFYESDSPTLIAERGDSVSLMYQVPAASGSKYEGRNESFWEHQGEASVDFFGNKLSCKPAP